jgi:hypothetical protein
VDKEILSCRGGEVIGDLYLFTEIVERRSGFAPDDVIRPTEKEFEAILCIVNQFEGRLESCASFLPRA